MRFGYALCAGLMLLAGCATQQPQPGAMEVSVSLSSMHRCSRISPEITVVNYPSGTANFDVLLQDRMDARKMHGGGIWPNDGSGVIPEGGLTRHYMGPCPSGGAREYQYRVRALDAQGNVLGSTMYIFVQE